MNKNKICFITCVNDERVYQESLLYIDHLIIPEGIEVQKIQIKHAPSITKGYNSAMHSTDAQYKVYLHQDVFIINKNFIQDVITVFQNHDNLGLMGVIGCKKLPSNGMWWESTELYGTAYDTHKDRMELLQFNDVHGDYAPVQCVDGLILITQYDITWREDLFTGWHFYDISQSLEFLRAGYAVGIPEQQTPWCIHDSGVPNISNGYEQYRQVFLNEYSKDLFPSVYELTPIPDRVHKEEQTELLRQWLVTEDDITLAKKLLSRSKYILNQHIFDAEQAMLSGDWEKAADLVQKAGKDAHYHHTGLFFSPDLENILKCCAENLNTICKQSITNGPKRVGDKRHVLHVFSEGYETGGHTRLAARWMEQDSESIHSVISLWAGPVMPKWIVDIAESSGGWYLDLGQKNLTLLLTAKVLREVAYSWADVIVLHIHPWDVIPSIAFGVDGGPPVMLLNHADHVFWIGAFIADMVAEIRPAGQDVTIKRRGTARSMLLSIPMAESATHYTRKSAREKLGIGEDAVLLLSIAATYKYTPCGNYNFLQMLYELVQKHPHAIVLVIGPPDEDEWRQLRIQTNGRVCAMGTQYDLDVFHCAADLYLDSFSIGSLTASLEAGLKGLPVVCFEKQIAKLLKIDDVSFGREQDLFPMHHLTYEQKIDALIKDVSLRNKVGNELAKKIKSDHIDGWNEGLQDLYSSLPAIHAILTEYEKISSWPEEDMIWSYLQYKTGWSYLYKGGQSL